MLALAVAMGIGRFAFTPLLPMMLHDGVVAASLEGRRLTEPALVAATIDKQALVMRDPRLEFLENKLASLGKLTAEEARPEAGWEDLRVLLEGRPIQELLYGKTSVDVEALACHPYDLCTAMLLEEAGGVVTDPRGGPLDVPLDTTTAVAWVGYANPALAGTQTPTSNTPFCRSCSRRRSDNGTGWIGARFHGGCAVSAGAARRARPRRQRARRDSTLRAVARLRACGFLGATLVPAAAPVATDSTGSRCASSSSGRPADSSRIRRSSSGPG